MSKKLVTKEYVDKEVVGPRIAVNSISDINNAISNHYGKTLYLVTEQLINFGGVILPAYSIIIIPCVCANTDMIGFVSNISVSGFWAIGYRANTQVWSVRQIY